MKRKKQQAIRWAKEQVKKNPELRDSILIEVSKRWGIGAELAVEKALEITWTSDDEEELE